MGDRENATDRMPYESPGTMVSDGWAATDESRIVSPYSPLEYHDAPEVVPGSVPQIISRPSSSLDDKTLVPTPTNHNSPSNGYFPAKNSSWYKEAEAGGLELAVIGGLETSPASGLEPVPAADGLEVVGISGGDEKVAEPAEAVVVPIPVWWKQKRVWIPALVAVLLIIGLTAGLVQGTRQGGGHDGSDSSGGNDNAHGSVKCGKADGGICPQILSHSRVEDLSFVFARTSDNVVQYFTNNGSGWDDEWRYLGKPSGELASQPTSAAWTIGSGTTNVGLFVTIGGDAPVVYWLVYALGEWSSDWKPLGGNPLSQPLVCVDNFLELFVTDGNTQDLVNNYFADPINSTQGNVEQGFPLTGSTPWRGSDDVGPMTSSASIVCYEKNEGETRTYVRDMAFYDKKGEPPAMRHAHYNTTDREVTDFEGTFVGEPTVFSFSDDPSRIAIFGIKASDDNEDDAGNDLIYVSYTSDDSGRGHAAPQNLGGSITSVPSVISLAAGVYDIVALGRGGTLRHLHYDESDEEREWEDLDVEAASAPLVVNIDGAVTIFAVDKDGKLVTLAVDDIETDTRQWADLLSSQTADTDLSLEFYTRP